MPTKFQEIIFFTTNAVFIKFLNDIFDRSDFADANRSLILALLFAVLAKFKAEAMPLVYRTCRRPFDPSGPLVVVVVVLVLGLVGVCSAGEMTFELPDNEKQCFSEQIEKDVNCVLEYQVFSGGNNDIDVDLLAPTREVLYSDRRQQYGSHSWKTQTSGEYTFCFSNQFSSFTHKMIYFDFQAGNEEPVKLGPGDVAEEMTQMETSLYKSFESLKNVIDYQKHHMLREAQGRSFAEDLNERVQFWSIGQTVIILIVGISQILVVRSFFSDHGHKRYGQQHKQHLST